MSLLIIRLVVFILVFWAGWRLWKIWQDQQALPNQPKQTDHESMVRCAHCGVHLPKSQALTQGDEYYCSEAHRDAGPGDSHNSDQP